MLVYAWLQMIGLGLISVAGLLSAAATYIGGVITLRIPGAPLPKDYTIHPIDWIGLSGIGFLAIAALSVPCTLQLTKCVSWAWSLPPSDAAGRSHLMALAALGTCWVVGATCSVSLLALTDFVSSASCGWTEASLAVVLPPVSITVALAQAVSLVPGVGPGKVLAPRTVAHTAALTALICALGMFYQVWSLRRCGGSGVWLDAVTEAVGSSHTAAWLQRVLRHEL